LVFTGTPIDATLDVFGKVVDAYTMTESVRDEIEKIEKYYEEAAEEGTNELSNRRKQKGNCHNEFYFRRPRPITEIGRRFCKTLR
jgi:type I restriction enzyme R subunit